MLLLLLGGVLMSLGVPFSSQPSITNTTNSFEYRVHPGDSLWLLSQRFGTSVDAIRTLNNLRSDALNVGQMLRIPATATTYTVQSGDTLWMLAQRFATSVNAIMSLNNLTSDNLSIGQILRIPS